MSTTVSEAATATPATHARADGREMPVSPAPRSVDERRAHALRLLETTSQLWLATGSPSGGAHLIPVSFVWDGDVITMATFAASRTAHNLRAYPRARLALGRTDDVVLIDADVEFVEVVDMDPTTADAFARVSHDPRQMPGLTYLRCRPDRILVWNGFHEFYGRTVMARGQWRRSKQVS